MTKLYLRTDESSHLETSILKSVSRIHCVTRLTLMFNVIEVEWSGHDVTVRLLERTVLAQVKYTCLKSWVSVSGCVERKVCIERKVEKGIFNHPVMCQEYTPARSAFIFKLFYIYLHVCQSERN